MNWRDNWTSKYLWLDSDYKREVIEQSHMLDYALSIDKTELFKVKSLEQIKRWAEAVISADDELSEPCGWSRSAP